MIENWLVYFGGFYLGHCVVIGIIEKLCPNIKVYAWFIAIISWLMIWVWICINFIANI